MENIGQSNKFHYKIINFNYSNCKPVLSPTQHSRRLREHIAFRPLRLVWAVIWEFRHSNGTKAIQVRFLDGTQRVFRAHQRLGEFITQFVNHSTETNLLFSRYSGRLSGKWDWTCALFERGIGQLTFKLQFSSDEKEIEWDSFPPLIFVDEVIEQESVAVSPRSQGVDTGRERKYFD